MISHCRQARTPVLHTYRRFMTLIHCQPIDGALVVSDHDVADLLGCVDQVNAVSTSVCEMLFFVRTTARNQSIIPSQ